MGVLWYFILAYLVILFIRFHVDLARNTTRIKERHISLFPQAHLMATSASANGHQGHVSAVVSPPK
jgi:hypothetical protein